MITASEALELIKTAKDNQDLNRLVGKVYDNAIQENGSRAKFARHLDDVRWYLAVPFDRAKQGAIEVLESYIN